MLTLQDVVRTAGRTAEAQRRFPYWIFWVVGVVFLAWVIGSMLTVFPWQTTGTSVAQPNQQTQIGPVIQQPAAQPASSADKPVQQVPEAVAPVIPVVVDYRGSPWKPAGDFNPFTIPVEAVPFNGTMSNLGWGATEIPEVRAYVLKVYPDLKDALAVLGAIARDEDVIMLSVFADYLDKPPTGRMAFSINGGKSWCNLLDLLPAGSRGEAGDVRVRVSDGRVYLYGQDSRPGYFWWEKIENRSEVPCS